METVIIKNACAVLSEGIRSNTALRIEEGKIAAINDGGEVPENAKVIDVKGAYLLPGFVDIHVHGGGGADFMDCTTEAFEKAVKTHLLHGTTTLVPTAMTASEENLTKFIMTFRKFKESSPFSSITPGVHLEGPYFSGANAKSSGAQPGNLMRLPDEKEIDRLLEAANGAILRWDAAPELAGSKMFARKMREKGIICSIAHSNATSEQAQTGIDNGFSHVTHFYNAVTTYHKREQTVCGGVVEAAYLNSNVCVELICDGKHIPKDILRLVLKIKGVHSVMGITDAMRIAGTKSLSGKLGSLEEGTEVIVDDGVAKLPDLSSYAGSIATMDRCLRVLCMEYGVSLSDASVMLSKTPAKLLGLGDKKGSIEVGKDADFVVADKALNVVSVSLAGNFSSMIF